MIKTKYTAYMIINRHKLVIVAAGLSALLLTAACSADAVDAPGATGSGSPRKAVADGNAITFSVSGEGSLTRTAEGTIADLDALKSEGIGVFACHHGIYAYESSNVSANFMWNQQVTWDGTNGVWTYEPVKYWPNGDGTEENKEYLSFFAYAPYSDADGSGCITDFSKNGETGDPWLVYQLGGTPDDWKSSQQDLLYAFTKDRQKGSDPSATRIPLTFRHALTTVGDRVTVHCGDKLLYRLQQARNGVADVTLTLQSVTLDYELTRKGRLVLNSSGTPNWKTIESEDATVHRRITFDGGNLVMARASAAGRPATADFVSADGNGIFMIPVEVKDSPQRLTLTATYTVGPWNYQTTESSTMSVSALFDAGKAYDLSLRVGDDWPVCPEEGSISFADTEEKALTVGQTYTSTLTNTSNGLVTYLSDNTAVATVSTTGLVTAVGAGSCTITATVADTDLTTYPVKTATYTVTVTAAP